MKALISTAAGIMMLSAAASAGTLSTEFASDGVGPADGRPCVFWVESLANGGSRWVGVDQTAPGGPGMTSRMGIWAAEKRQVWLSLYNGNCGNITVGQACGDTAGSTICATQ